MFQHFRNYRFIPVLAAFAVVCLPTLGKAVEPVRVVGTGGRMGNNTYDPGTVNTSFRQRTQHKLGGPVAEMQIAFMDWVVYYEGEVPNPICDVTITHAWLERASTGQIVPLTFSGSRQLVMPKNSTTAYWPSDAIPSSKWNGATPARDEIFWLHVKGSVPAGGRIPMGPGTTWSGAKFIAYPPANDPNTFDTGGTVPAITGSATRNNGLPLIFLGRYTGPGHLSVIGIGDSILDGTGDQANPLPSVAGYGFFNRAAVDANGANAIAMFNLTRHGQSASNFANPSRRQRQVQFLPFANVVVEEYGTNDLGTNGTGNATTLLTNVNTIWTLARAAGVQKIIRTKLMPRTSSTDNWMSPEGQTPKPEWGIGGKRDTINAGFATALADGKIDVLLDTHSVIADPTDNTRWRTNGTAKYVNVDEAHVSPAGNILLAPVLRAALLGLRVDPAPKDYSSWSATIPWGGTDSAFAADPNHDGLQNGLAYAMDLSPLVSNPSEKLPRVEMDNTTPGSPWLSLAYRENRSATGLTYQIQACRDLGGWAGLTADGVSVISEIIDEDPDGDGSALVRRIRMKVPDGEACCFMRLKVEY